MCLSKGSLHFTSGFTEFMDSTRQCDHETGYGRTQTSGGELVYHWQEHRAVSDRSSMQPQPTRHPPGIIILQNVLADLDKIKIKTWESAWFPPTNGWDVYIECSNGGKLPNVSPARV